MNKLSKAVIALLLALIMATMLPLQAFAAMPDYVSEVKIGMGKTVAEAEKALEGYTIVKRDGKSADLNEDAGADIDSGLAGGKGEKVVLLGYQTTKNKNEAITDLALLNMTGDYTFQNFEASIEKALNGEIIPFIDSFIAAIQEYRENYDSDIPENYARAEYIHDLLNRLTDDDTGMGLGDLLLNETKYEMGDDAYNKLSAAQKKKHGDILTILLQANGKALVLMKKLIAWSTDTGEDTWLDRFSQLTYDELLENAENEFDYGPRDAKQYLAREYEDDAKKILKVWSAFQEQIENYEETKEIFEEKLENEDEYQELNDTLESIDLENATEDELDEYAKAAVDLEAHSEIMRNAASDVAAVEILEEIPYEGGTMLDFFLQDYEDVYDDTTVLFPLIASLSDGQRASLDFLTLSELVRMTKLSIEGISEVDFEEIPEISIYLGVNRNMFGMTNVAGTPDAVKKDVAMDFRDPLADEIWNSEFEILGIQLEEVVAIVMGLVKIGTNGWKLISMGLAINTWGFAGVFQYSQISTISTKTLNAIKSHLNTQLELLKNGENAIKTTVKDTGLVDRISGASSTLDKFLNGLSYVLIIYTAYSVYSTWKEIHEHFDVEFTSAPDYMVDVADLMAYNENGEKVLIGDVTNYYSAVTCNRTDKDEMYEPLKNVADMNGDVGREWLALYATKGKAAAPILADSFVVKVGKDGGNIPAGYSTGIHMFGTPAALDLNTTKYDWNNGLGGIYVYYKTDSNAKTAASIFSSGTTAIAIVSGLVLGSIGTAVAMTVKKKKETVLQTTN